MYVLKWRVAMQIVIDIPEEIIKDAKESPNYYPSYLFGTIWKSIGNGTPLPKGHGRLIDADKLLDEFTELNAVSFYEANEHSREAYYELKNCIKNAPTVLEADMRGDTDD